MFAVRSPLGSRNCVNITLRDSFQTLRDSALLVPRHLDATYPTNAPGCSVSLSPTVSVAVASEESTRVYSSSIRVM